MGSYNMNTAGATFSRNLAMTVTAFAGIALYNVIELMTMILFTFRKRHGLYFYSMLAASLAIIPYTLGLLFKFFHDIPSKLNELVATAIILGWCFMVTGQSMVLFSRLHLVVYNRKVVRAVLYMIIANFFISNIPIAILVYGSNSNNPDPWLPAYGIWERLQVALYFVQETIVSAIYVYEVFKLGRSMRDSVSSCTLSETPQRSQRTKRKRKIMRHLIYINLIVILIDITLLVTEFLGFYEVQVLFKGAAYSVKLKLEFRVLTQLMHVAEHTKKSSQAYFFSSIDRSESIGSPLVTMNQKTQPFGEEHTVKEISVEQSLPEYSKSTSDVGPLDTVDEEDRELFRRCSVISPSAFSAAISTIPLSNRVRPTYRRNVTFAEGEQLTLATPNLAPHWIMQQQLSNNGDQHQPTAFERHQERVRPDITHQKPSVGYIAETIKQHKRPLPELPERVDAESPSPEQHLRQPPYESSKSPPTTNACTS